MTADDCIFCRIVEGRLEASVVAQTPTVVAIMDLDPVTPGHVLVLPLAHLPALADLPDELAAEMLSFALSVGAALRAAPLRCEGVNLFYADGWAAFQDVFHAHLHVFPRYPGDGFTINARWGSNPTRDELDNHAAQIRERLKGCPSPRA